MGSRHLRQEQKVAGFRRIYMLKDGRVVIAMAKKRWPKLPQARRGCEEAALRGGKPAIRDRRSAARERT